MELVEPLYPDLVRVFYFNLKISEGTLCSRVKGVDIKLTEDVWYSITLYIGKKKIVSIFKL